MVETIANATITNIGSPSAPFHSMPGLIACLHAPQGADYFFFSAFHTVREIARPQNGQKFIKNKLGRSSGERTA